MNFRCKFRHHRSIRRPRFPIRMPNFSDLATFSVDYCSLYSECPPYFYFRFIWPTDLESIPHASTPTSIIPTKFEVDIENTLPSYSVFVCWYVTWPCDLDLWLFDLEQLQFMAGHVTNLDTKFEDPMRIRSWFMSHNVSVGYPWECVRGHCACAESRDPWVGAQKQLHFWNPRLWFAYSLCNFGGSTMKVIKVICENNARPCVKRRMSFCACAKSCDMLEVT